MKIVNVTLANDSGKDGCKLDGTARRGGPVRSRSPTPAQPGITEMELLKDQRIVGEKENLAPGLDPFSFTVTLDGGIPDLLPPGAGNEYPDFTVTGQAPPPGGRRADDPQRRHQGAMPPRS